MMISNAVGVMGHPPLPPMQTNCYDAIFGTTISLGGHIIDVSATRVPLMTQGPATIIIYVAVIRYLDYTMIPAYILR